MKEQIVKAELVSLGLPPDSPIQKWTATFTDGLTVEILVSPMEDAGRESIAELAQHIRKSGGRFPYTIVNLEEGLNRLRSWAKIR
jgi:hypothetical protein